MVPAEILCTCGQRFTVADDGTGSPHPCPSCKVHNVLPRRVNGASSARAAVLAETVGRGTEVLSRAGLVHRTLTEGLPQGTQLGPYRLERRIGRGGMGSVYAAIDERSGGRVALKVLSPELAQRPDFVARFHREARALSGLSDERIAKVFFSGAADGLPFFAMEFVDGRNLEEQLAQDGKFDARRAIALMREAAVGLSSAARRGIIHRDVKPTNLLVDRLGKLRIVDFGLAKAIDSESRLTITGAVVGTPFYLSPEQGLGKAVDQRSDIYSLGATFYHLLTGAPPFDADSPVSIIMKHINDAPEALSRRAGGVPEALGRIVMRCLAKDPRRRYQDYEELIDDLDAAAKGEPVAAPAEEVSIQRSQPSYVVVDELEDGSRLLRRSTVFRRALSIALDAAVLKLMHRAFYGLMPGGVDPAWFFLPVGFLYLAVGDGLGGASLGKRFFRLKVARPNGNAPGPLHGLLRMIALLPLFSLVLWFRRGGFQGPTAAAMIAHDMIRQIPVQGVPLDAVVLSVKVLAAVAVVDIAFVLFTRRGESLHDVVSGTAVFREDRVKRRQRTRPLKERPVSPVLTLVFSVIPGGGQLVNGEVGKALLVFIAIVVGMLQPVVGLALWAAGALEAWSVATSRQREWDATHGTVRD